MIKKILSSLVVFTIIATSTYIFARINTTLKSDDTLKKEATYTFEYQGEKMVMNKWRTDDVYIDFKTATIYIGEIKDFSTYLKIDDAAKAMELMGVKKITFNMHSPGGEVNTMNLIIIEMDILKSHGITIVTQVDENNSCMSACTLIYLNGSERIAHRKSVFMIHSPAFSGIDPFGEREAAKIYKEQDLDSSRAVFKKKFTEMCGVNSSIISNVYDKINHFYPSRKLQETCPAYITKITGNSPLDPTGKHGF